MLSFVVAGGCHDANYDNYPMPSSYRQLKSRLIAYLRYSTNTPRIGSASLGYIYDMVLG